MTRTGFIILPNQITLTYEADQGASPGPRTITVSNSAGSATASVTVASPYLMKLELVGTVISTDGKYTEDSTIRVTAVDSSGATATTFTGMVNILEDTSGDGYVPIYSQWPSYGASLPPSVTISSGGTATFVAKSLAGPKTVGQNGAPPNPALIKTNLPTYGGASLSVAQWITSGQIDPLASGPVYDWFQHRIQDIFKNANGDLATVLATISSYSLDGTIDAGAQTPGVWGSTKSSVKFNPFSAAFRLDSAQQQGLCGLPASSKILTHTLYHEARHAYMFSLTSIANNDEDQDYLVNNIPIAPANIMIDTTAARSICNEITTDVRQFSFLGKNHPDAYGSLTPAPGVPGVWWAMEMDANIFASQH